ncbi:MAG: hypothetical protein L6R43_02395, partial [Planctomycetes bacterium]|nr:hypothetical protein [Planctomycetota bacterium]
MAPIPDPPPPDLGRARGLLGAVLGTALGAGAWALLASLAGPWSGWAALPLGALAGLGSKRLGGKGTGAAAAAAAVALAGILLGQGFAAGAKHEADLRGRLAAVDRERYDDFAAAADSAALETAKARYLGKGGSLTELLKGLGKLDPEARKTAGAEINKA